MENWDSEVGHQCAIRKHSTVNMKGKDAEWRCIDDSSDFFVAWSLHAMQPSK
jgi:hypothetical protein